MFAFIASQMASLLGNPTADDRRRRNRASSRIANRSQEFAGDQNGSIAIIFALSLVAFCLFVGAGVDFGRWQAARQQTIAAMDAAVLAGGRILQLNDKDVTGAREAALKYYQENTKNRPEVIDDTIAFDAVDNNTAFAATGNAYIKTAFLGFANIPRLALLDVSESQYSKALLKAGGKENTPVEISMMLDVTGSMGGTKIKDLKTAATDLVNIVISDSANANPVRVAIVPFAEGVRLPSSANTKARGTPASSVTYPYSTRNGTSSISYYPTECVVERTGANKYTDVAPGSGNYVMTLFNRAGGSYGICGLPAADELVPLTNNKTTLTNKIANLVLSNTTAGQIGTAWTWYTLSPNWNSLWSASSAAAAYGSDTRKIAILMTDGEYNLQYDAKGVQTSSTGAGSAANGDSATQARAVCTAMKAKGITVYTVGFALGGNATAIQTLDHCATDPSKAYTPNTGSELQQAFRDIALKINQLYLTH